MKIYTRTGDDGTTGLFGGSRVGKDDARVEAYGAVDEVVACIGLARSLGAGEALDGLLERIQRDLFVLGAELACVPGKEAKLGLGLVGETQIAYLEEAIDHLECQVDPLKAFILPGGTQLAATLHIARTVCRRAERRTIALQRLSAVRPEVVMVLNRLSDALFVMGRFANHLAGVSDVPWEGRAAG